MPVNPEAVLSSERLRRDYEMLYLLARGGHGLVVVVRRKADDVVLAAKIGNLTTLGKEQRLLETSVLSMRVLAPFVTRLVEDFEVGNHYVLIMEFACGGDFQQRLKSGAVASLADARNILIQLVYAVGTLHSFGLVHRDIKPANLLFTHDGTVKLADFGLCRSGVHRLFPRDHLANCSGMHELMQRAPYPIAVTQLDVIVFVNERLRRDWGYTSEMLVGQNVSIFMPPSFANRHSTYIHRYVQQRDARLINCPRNLPILLANRSVRVHTLVLLEAERGPDTPGWLNANIPKASSTGSRSPVPLPGALSAAALAGAGAGGAAAAAPGGCPFKAATDAAAAGRGTRGEGEDDGESISAATGSSTPLGSKGDSTPLARPPGDGTTTAAASSARRTSVGSSRCPMSGRSDPNDRSKHIMFIAIFVPPHLRQRLVTQNDRPAAAAAASPPPKPAATTTPAPAARTAGGAPILQPLALSDAKAQRAARRAQRDASDAPGSPTSPAGAAAAPVARPAGPSPPPGRDGSRVDMCGWTSPVPNALPPTPYGPLAAAAAAAKGAAALHAKAKARNARLPGAVAALGGRIGEVGSPGLPPGRCPFSLGSSSASPVAAAAAAAATAVRRASLMAQSADAGAPAGAAGAPARRFALPKGAQLVPPQTAAAVARRAWPLDDAVAAGTTAAGTGAGGGGGGGDRSPDSTPRPSRDSDPANRSGHSAPRRSRSDRPSTTPRLAPVPLAALGIGLTEAAQIAAARARAGRPTDCTDVAVTPFGSAAALVVSPRPATEVSAVTPQSLPLQALSPPAEADAVSSMLPAPPPAHAPPPHRPTAASSPPAAGTCPVSGARGALAGCPMAMAGRGVSAAPTGPPSAVGVDEATPTSGGSAGSHGTDASTNVSTLSPPSPPPHSFASHVRTQRTSATAAAAAPAVTVTAAALAPPGVASATLAPLPTTLPSNVPAVSGPGRSTPTRPPPAQPIHLALPRASSAASDSVGNASPYVVLGDAAYGASAVEYTRVGRRSRCAMDAGSAPRTASAPALPTPRRHFNVSLRRVGGSSARGSGGGSAGRGGGHSSPTGSSAYAASVAGSRGVSPDGAGSAAGATATGMEPLLPGLPQRRNTWAAEATATTPLDPCAAPPRASRRGTRPAARGSSSGSPAVLGESVFASALRMDPMLQAAGHAHPSSSSSSTDTDHDADADAQHGAEERHSSSSSSGMDAASAPELIPGAVESEIHVDRFGAPAPPADFGTEPPAVTASQPRQSIDPSVFTRGAMRRLRQVVFGKQTTLGDGKDGDSFDGRDSGGTSLSHELLSYGSTTTPEGPQFGTSLMPSVIVHGVQSKEPPLIGTMEFMAPEIVAGRTHGPPADWWSVGCLFYQMVTGHHPFASTDRSLTREQRLVDTLMRVAKCSPSYAGDRFTEPVVQVCRALLTANTAQRACFTDLIEMPFLSGKVSVPQMPPPPACTRVCARNILLLSGNDLGASAEQHSRFDDVMLMAGGMSPGAGGSLPSMVSFNAPWPTPLSRPSPHITPSHSTVPNPPREPHYDPQLSSTPDFTSPTMAAAALRLGQFITTSVLGSGRSGVVYTLSTPSELAPETSSELVIKVFADPQPDMLVRLLYLAQLRHPNIISIVKFGFLESGKFAVLMERAEHGSVDSLIKRKGPLPLPEVALILRGVLEGLVYLHGCRVIHRDIKPGNLMLSHGIVKITDFGACYVSPEYLEALDFSGYDQSLLDHRSADARSEISHEPGTPIGARPSTSSPGPPTYQHIAACGTPPLSGISRRAPGALGLAMPHNIAPPSPAGPYPHPFIGFTSTPRSARDRIAGAGGLPDWASAGSGRPTPPYSRVPSHHSVGSAVIAAIEAGGPPSEGAGGAAASSSSAGTPVPASGTPLSPLGPIPAPALGTRGTSAPAVSPGQSESDGPSGGGGAASVSHTPSDHGSASRLPPPPPRDMRGSVSQSSFSEDRTRGMSNVPRSVVDASPRPPRVQQGLQSQSGGASRASDHSYSLSPMWSGSGSFTAIMQTFMSRLGDCDTSKYFGCPNCSTESSHASPTDSMRVVFSSPAAAASVARSTADVQVLLDGSSASPGGGTPLCDELGPVVTSPSAGALPHVRTSGTSIPSAAAAVHSAHAAALTAAAAAPLTPTPLSRPPSPPTSAGVANTSTPALPASASFTVPSAAASATGSISSVVAAGSLPLPTISTSIGRLPAPNADAVRALTAMSSSRLSTVAGPTCVRCGGQTFAKMIPCARPVDGTLVYMSPECVRGEAFGEACDIWAVGMTVLEMATGLQPWSHIGSDAASEVALMYAMRAAGFVHPIPDDLEPDLRDFISRCLELDASRRATALELLSHPFVLRFAQSGAVVSSLAEWLSMQQQHRSHPWQSSSPLSSGSP